MIRLIIFSKKDYYFNSLLVLLFNILIKSVNIENYFNNSSNFFFSSANFCRSNSTILSGALLT